MRLRPHDEDRLTRAITKGSQLLCKDANVMAGASTGLILSVSEAEIRPRR